jgi:hypothetical protein
MGTTEAVEPPVAAEAKRLRRICRADGGKSHDLLRIEKRDGVAVAFYRRIDTTATEESTLLAVVVDEDASGTWRALCAAELRSGGCRHLTARPSARGDWSSAIYGSALPSASAAIVGHEGVEHRVAVPDGVYAFMTRASTEPEVTLTKTRFAKQRPD